MSTALNGTILDGKQLVLGTCYYPEHWPEHMWREDLQRMLEAGIQVIRVAEFAWSLMEPEEGRFTWNFWGRFLTLCDEVGMKVILCTPTATPPAWLTEKYPESLNCDLSGIPYRHGARKHCGYNAPVFRMLCARIVEKMAQQYAGYACVIGWQLDNELNCETDQFYAPADTDAFRLWLRDRYQTLDALNEAWGTVFWNQTYTAWEQVFVPRRTVPNSVNPHEVLDYIRFVSHSARDFAGEHARILRRYLKPGDFITTNGLFGSIDNHQLVKDSLDFMTYDSYPNFAYCLDNYRAEDTGLRDRNWVRSLMDTRACSGRFGIMEQQSGANGWNSRMEAPTPRPGQLTLWTMQSIAHGADFVSYFRWRTATMGTEIYWHGILDYSSRENRRIREVRDVHQLLSRLQPVAGTVHEARVAMLKDYDNIFDAKVDRWHERVARQSEAAILSACQRSHTPLDFVYLDHADDAQLARYDLIFCPHAVIMTEDRAAMLTRYTAQGGKLVFGCRSAYKDMNGRCTMEKLPGLIAPLTGADVVEYSFIAPDAPAVTIDWQGEQLEAAVFTDLVEALPGAALEGTYTSDYYAGSGALVSRREGAGTAYYYGTAFTEQAVAVFLRRLGCLAPLAEVIDAPEGVELAVRAGENGRFLFMLNYDKEPATVTLKRPCMDMATDEAVQGEVTLPGYGVKVLRL